jgi:acetyl esterase/lipase
MSVPIGYIVGLLVLAFPAIRFPRVPMAVGTSVLFLVVGISELPVLAVAAFVASTGIAYAEGDLTSPVTIVAAALAAACIALTTWRGTRAKSVLEGALGAGALPRLPVRRIFLLPFGVRPRSVQRIANLSYGPAGKRNLLDVYRRRSGTANAPVLIHFHGGYYATGFKNSQSLPMLHRFAEQGWVCISANYRFRPEAGLEEHIIDVKRVVAWVRAHADEFGVDPDRIVLSGSSAGAHMSTMAAFTPGVPAYQPGFEEVDTSVSAVVMLGAYYDAYFDRPETDPVTFAGPEAPPFLIVHGSHDSVVPAARARRFADRLRAVSTQPVAYAELPGAHHGFDLFHSPRFEAVIAAVAAFTTAAFASASARSSTSS